MNLLLWKMDFSIFFIVCLGFLCRWFYSQFSQTRVEVKQKVSVYIHTVALVPLTFVANSQVKHHWRTALVAVPRHAIFIVSYNYRDRFSLFSEGGARSQVTGNKSNSLALGTTAILCVDNL